MRLAKIELRDFRGYPGPQTYSFDLAGGRNLLLYGENGSGKSSLYRALVEFLNLDPKARSFGWHRNVFSSGPEQSSIEGRITLELDGGERPTWNCLGRRPYADLSLPRAIREKLTDAARRASLLEYRSLLRTNFGVTNLKERLFELAVTTLLANVPVALPGSREKTIAELWKELLASRPGRHTARTLRAVAAAEKAFNDGFGAIIPDVQRKATEFLSYFAGTHLDVVLKPPAVQYVRALRAVTNRHLDFEVKLRGVVVLEWNDFLNEARLSALALSLYLAGAALSNPTPPASVGVPLKLLVLDDVLIGLDLANRIPVLDLVGQEFVRKGWQVLLLTFDRAWYEVARQHLRDGNWKHYELYTSRVGSYEAPILVPDEDHLYRAIAFLAQGEVKAAAVHVRSAFEIVLKSACFQLALPVKFNPDPRKVPASDLWSALKAAVYTTTPAPQVRVDGKGRSVWWVPKAQTHRVVPIALEHRIEHAVSWVLNPLSHSQIVDRYRAEIEDAIYAIDELSTCIQFSVSARDARPVDLLQMMASVLQGRVAQLKAAAASTPLPPSTALPEASGPLPIGPATSVTLPPAPVEPSQAGVVERQSPDDQA